MLETMERVSPSMMPLTMSWTWLRPVAMVAAPFFALTWPSESPVRRTAYFSREALSSCGPMVKTAGTGLEVSIVRCEEEARLMSYGQTAIFRLSWPGEP
jgi:hypothetical protein